MSRMSVGTSDSYVFILKQTKRLIAQHNQKVYRIPEPVRSLLKKAVITNTSAST